MFSQRVNRAGARGLLPAAQAGLVVMVAALSLAAGGAQAADQPLKFSNSTVETTVKMNGAISQTTVGDRNDVRINAGTSIRGVNVENSRITTKVTMNGAILQNTVGDRNKVTLNLGTELTAN